jgi:AcrR family transcriptional regulator
MAGVKGQVQRRGVERRKEILEAALELFTRRGARGTSVADIAEKVGISAPAVLHHFRTKDALLLAVIEERDKRGAVEFSELLAEGGLAGLARMVEAAEVNEAERGLVACFVVLEAENLQEGDIAHQYFVERSEVMRAFFASLLAEAQARGEVRADVDPVVKGTEIVAFMEGAAMVWSLDPTTSLVALYRSYVDALLRDLAADPR